MGDPGLSADRRVHRKTAYLPPGWLRRERDRRHRPAPSGRCAWTRRAIDESGFGRLEVLVPGVVDAGLLRVPADIDDTAAGERSAAAAPKLDDARRLLATTLRSVLAGALVDVTAGSARPVVVGEVGGLPVDVANVEPDAVREAVAGLGSSAAGLKVLSRRLQVAAARLARDQRPRRGPEARSSRQRAAGRHDRQPHRSRRRVGPDRAVRGEGLHARRAAADRGACRVVGAGTRRAGPTPRHRGARHEARVGVGLAAGARGRPARTGSPLANSATRGRCGRIGGAGRPPPLAVVLDDGGREFGPVAQAGLCEHVLEVCLHGAACHRAAVRRSRGW